MNSNEKETVFDIPDNVGFYDMKHTTGINSARMKDVLYNLPKTITEILSPPLPKIGNS